MSEDGGPTAANSPGDSEANVSDEFIRHLEDAGFFRQIQDLESTLARLAGDIQVLGESTVRSMNNAEGLVSHILALESVVAVLLRSTPVEPEAVKAEIRQRTAQASDDAEGSPEVLAAAEVILARAGS